MVSFHPTYYRINDKEVTSPELAERQGRFMRIVTLYQQAKAMGKIKPEFVEAIDSEMAGLGKDLNISFDKVVKIPDIKTAQDKYKQPDTSSNETSTKKSRSDSKRSGTTSKSDPQQKPEEPSPAVGPDGLDQPSKRSGTRSASAGAGRGLAQRIVSEAVEPHRIEQDVILFEGKPYSFNELKDKGYPVDITEGVAKQKGNHYLVQLRGGYQESADGVIYNIYTSKKFKLDKNDLDAKNLVFDKKTRGGLSEYSRHKQYADYVNNIPTENLDKLNYLLDELIGAGHDIFSNHPRSVAFLAELITEPPKQKSYRFLVIGTSFLQAIKYLYDQGILKTDKNVDSLGFEDLAKSLQSFRPQINKPTKSEAVSARTGSGRLNFNLREKPALKLTKGQRHKLNQRAIELLNTGAKSFTEAELNEIRQYTGYGGLQVDSAGILNQHYTSYPVTKFVWDKLVSMGVDSGYFLEPGCGIGNWAGLKPNENINIVGFDYDTVAINIAQHLYPQDRFIQADIKEFDFKGHGEYISGAVGNVPFGNYKRYSKNDTFAKLKPLIHDSFILKTVEAVRPGGVIALISSAGTMNKKTTRVREAVIEMAHFLGAYRLPNTAFRDNASTIVTTDIIFLQKRNGNEAVSTLDNQFIESVTIEEGVTNSKYFIDHPEMVLGTTEVGAAQFGRQLGVIGELTDELLTQKLKTTDISLAIPFITRKEPPAKLANPELVVEPKPVLAAQDILSTLKRLVNLQQEQADGAAKKAQRINLKSKLDTFIKNHGFPQEKKVRSVLQEHFNSNSDYYQLITLIKQKNGKTMYSQIVEQDTVFSGEFVPKAASNRLPDVILYARQSGVSTEPEALAELMNVPVSEIKTRAEADKDVFLDPDGQNYVLTFEYLQGNIYEKLDKALAANLTKNIQALNAVLPTPKTLEEITIDVTGINSFIPKEVGDAYIKFLLDGELIGAPRAWTIVEAKDNRKELHRIAWRDHDKELEDYLNLRDYPAQPVTRSNFVSDEDYNKQLAHSKRMKLKNNAKMRRQIPKRFKDWLMGVASQDIREDVVKRWNRAFNNSVTPVFTGETFSMAEMASTWTNGLPFKPKSHQKAFVERALYTGSMVNAHGVGAGKTLTTIMLVHALKERGLAKKPMIAAPSKVVEKWIDEHLAAFPNARILNLKTTKGKKEELLSMAQQNDYDAIYVTHEGFSAIPVSPEVQEAYMKKRLDFIDKRIKAFESQFTEEEREIANRLAKNDADYEKATAKAKAEGTDKPTKRSIKVPQKTKSKIKHLKEAYKQRFDMQNKLENVMEAEKLDSIYFDDIGFDALFIDEAHNFKNLYLSPKAAQLGIGVASSSNRAEELFMKTDWLNQKTGERNIHLLTATPTNNTPLEAYIFLQMIAPTLMEREMGVESVDDFVELFALIETKTVYTVSQTYQDRQIVVGYKDLNTLRGLFNRYFEYLDLAEAGEVVRPKLISENEIIQPTALDEAIKEHLLKRVEDIKNDGGKLPSGALDSFQVLATTGRRAAIDPALYIYPEVSRIKTDSGKLIDGSKADTLCRNVAKNYWKTPKNVTSQDGIVTKGALNGQLIFCDPVTTTSEKNYHRRLRDRLVELGVPKNMIAIVNGGENSKPEDKKRIQDRFNSLEIRVIIGNTASMGEGMDLNRYCTHIHHLDLPWKPSELIQRNGRGHRQGNVNGEIRVIYYLLKNSMDIYMNNMLDKKIRWFNELWRGSSDYMDNLDDDGVGMDYEDIRMQLESNPEIIKTLSLSKDVRELLDQAETADEDFKDMSKSIKAIKSEFSAFESSVDLSALRKYETLPEIPEGGYDELVEAEFLKYEKTWSGFRTSVKPLSDTYSFSGYASPAYGSINFSFPTRTYTGKSTEEKDAKAKILGAMVRYWESYPKQREKALADHERLEKLVPNYESRIQDAKKEAISIAWQTVKAYTSLYDFVNNHSKPDDLEAVISQDIEEHKPKYFGQLEKWETTAKDAGIDVSGFRANPMPVLAYLGRVIKLETDNAVLEGDDFMFSTHDGGTIYIVPEARVTPAGKKIVNQKAQSMHETFKHYPADHNDFAISLPDGVPKKHGTAEKIWYSSDKIIQSGDRKGKVNHYVHDFDAGKRPVYELDDIIIIKNLQIDARGILN